MLFLLAACGQRHDLRNHRLDVGRKFQIGSTAELTIAGARVVITQTTVVTVKALNGRDPSAVRELIVESTQSIDGQKEVLGDQGLATDTVEDRGVWQRTTAERPGGEPDQDRADKLASFAHPLLWDVLPAEPMKVGERRALSPLQMGAFWEEPLSSAFAGEGHVTLRSVEDGFATLDWAMKLSVKAANSEREISVQGDMRTFVGSGLIERSELTGTFSDREGGEQNSGQLTARVYSSICSRRCPAER
jgi:hypothetical protein